MTETETINHMTRLLESGRALIETGRRKEPREVESWCEGASCEGIIEEFEDRP